MSSTSNAATAAKQGGNSKSHDILTCTIRAPQFAYAQMELVTSNDYADGSQSQSQFQKPALDSLQVKTYCTNALRQFLGLTGAAIPVDVLKAQGTDCWVRVPRDDLGSFAAAMTSWRGTREDGVHYLLRLKQCSDWLGAMVGSSGQDEIWNA